MMRSKVLGIMGLFAMLIGIVSTVHAGVIYVDEADGMLEMRSDWTDPAVHNTDDWQVNLGEWWGNGLTAYVMPFQLPNLGVTNNPFTSADLGLHVFGKSGSVATDIDLYAVRTDASPTILATDYYHGAAPDPSATLLQASILTPATVPSDPGPNVNTDAAGDAALLNYLNSAYAGGAGAGDYVFLRLNFGDTYATAWDSYQLTTRNTAVDTDWAVINYDAIPEPATLAFLGIAGSMLMFLRRLNII